MGDVIKGPWPDRNEEVLTLVVNGAPRSLPLAMPAKRSCHKCINAAYGPRGTWCLEYSEAIDNETLAASDCPLYEPEDPDGAA